MFLQFKTPFCSSTGIKKILKDAENRDWWAVAVARCSYCRKFGTMGIINFFWSRKCKVNSIFQELFYSRFWISICFDSTAYRRIQFHLIVYEYILLQQRIQRNVNTLLERHHNGWNNYSRHCLRQWCTTSGPRRTVMWLAMSNRKATILHTTLALNPLWLAYLIQHLNFLNLKVHGVNKLGYRLTNHVSAFKTKPMLSQQRVGPCHFIHFILSS